MSREKNEPQPDSDPKFNPYEIPRPFPEPAGGQLEPWTRFSPEVNGPISVTHGLTDAELRRFCECDVFYDPKPLFGFLPQWIWVLPITGAIGFFFGLLRLRSYQAAVVSGPALSLIVLAIMVVRARARRNTARLAGLCGARTLTIAPGGLTLAIPGARPVPNELACVGPLELRWGDFLKIEATETDIVFWLTRSFRLILPRRVFSNPAEADAFLQAASRWHTEAADPRQATWETAWPDRRVERPLTFLTSTSAWNASGNGVSAQADTPKARPWRQWLLIVTVVLGLAGQALLRSSSWKGVIVSSAGEALVYQSSKWMLALLGFPFGLMIANGLAIVTLRHPLARLFGGGVLVVSVASLAMIPATIMTGKLVVTPEGFTHTAGFWWNPVTHAVRFDALESMRMIPSPKSDGPPSFVLECVEQDGKIVRIPKSDLLAAGLREIILRHAAAWNRQEDRREQDAASDSGDR